MVRPLPAIMVAPNGARRQKRDVPGLPVTVDEIVLSVTECAGQGADGFHLHVRSESGEHLLDEGLYRELLLKLENQLPGGYFQVTTEAVGRYTPEQQRLLVRALRPKATSIAVRELFRDRAEDQVNRAFLEGCAANDVAVQFIVYDNGDVDRLAGLVDEGVVPAQHLQLLQVIGVYGHDKPSETDVVALTQARLAHQRSRLPETVDWAVCCFGPDETRCLAAVRHDGGKVRIGFENNVLNSNGSMARSNAERVQDLLAYLSNKDWAVWVRNLSILAV